MTNCLMCGKPLRGTQRKFCSRSCDHKHGYLRRMKDIDYNASVDPLSEKLKQEYGNLRVYAR